MRLCNYFRKEYQKCRSQELGNKYKALRSEVNHKMRRAKAAYFVSICQDLK